MTTYSPCLGLPLIEAAQAQKHVTHNAALERLDTIVQLQVQQFGATTPPTAPQEGLSWALGTDPVGFWAGQNAWIATFSGGGWIYVIPRPGWRAWGVAEATLRVWTDTGWARSWRPKKLVRHRHRCRLRSLKPPDCVRPRNAVQPCRRRLADQGQQGERCGNCQSAVS
jgi:hypothetical protein